VAERTTRRYRRRQPAAAIHRGTDGHANHYEERDHRPPTTDPRPFDPCEDIPFDVIARLGLSFTPPEHEEGLRCHYDAGNYQLAVEAIIWHEYAQSLPTDAIETTVNGHRAAQHWVFKPTYHNSFW
jgi:hypothetical protein